MCDNFRENMFYNPHFIVHNAADYRWVGKLTDFQHPYESVQWELH